MASILRSEESGYGALSGGQVAVKCHFCVLVNQWCRGSDASGRPDDCIGCGRCEQRGDG